MTNRLGELVKNHWQRTDPARYQAIEDPQTFFRELGERAEQEVQELADRLAGPDQPGEQYLEKVGRLNMARLQAEEAILSELLIAAPATSTDETPASDPLTQAMREIHEALAEDDPQD